jgi:hypothetical protein
VYDAVTLTGYECLKFSFFEKASQYLPRVIREEDILFCNFGAKYSLN